MADDSNRGVWAVFPGVGSAGAAARRLSAKLAGSTIRPLEGGNSLVEAHGGDRSVAITCPPSTAYVVVLHEGPALVAEGETLEDVEALALATRWLAGGDLGGILSETPFLRARRLT